jgi:hypothetical protein
MIIRSCIVNKEVHTRSHGLPWERRPHGATAVARTHALLPRRHVYVPTLERGNEKRASGTSYIAPVKKKLACQEMM